MLLLIKSIVIAPLQTLLMCFLNGLSCVNPVISLLPSRRFSISPSSMKTRTFDPTLYSHFYFFHCFVLYCTKLRLALCAIYPFFVIAYCWIIHSTGGFAASLKQKNTHKLKPQLDCVRLSGSFLMKAFAKMNTCKQKMKMSYQRLKCYYEAYV